MKNYQVDRSQHLCRNMWSTFGYSSFGLGSNNYRFRFQKSIDCESKIEAMRVPCIFAAVEVFRISYFFWGHEGPEAHFFDYYMIFGLISELVFYDYSESRFSYEITDFATNVVLLGESITLNVRVRFRRSLELPTWKVISESFKREHKI